MPIGHPPILLHLTGVLRKSDDGDHALALHDQLLGPFRTGHFRNIHREIEQAFDLHDAAGTRLGGVHLELTGENVTECLGGARQLTEVDLQRDYRSTVDPRLNYEQALEIAMLIVRKRGAMAD